MPDLDMKAMEQEVVGRVVQFITDAIKKEEKKKKVSCDGLSFRSFVMLQIVEYLIKHDIPLTNAKWLFEVSNALTQKIKSILMKHNIEVTEQECFSARIFYDREQELER